MKSYDLDFKEFFEIIWSKELVTELIIGKINRQVWWSKLREKNPVLKELPQNFVWDMLEEGNYLDNEILNYIKTLNKLNVGILSNADVISKVIIKKQTEGLNLDFIYTSSDFGVAKPNAKIFTRLLEELKKDASECVFFDDSAKNVEGAKKVGIESYVYQNTKELESIITTLTGNY